ncbi:chymotrypsin-2-like [Diachasma alloeum]|uniref:chymotrypsin-2-like n=1 Tax=Diachasma alloeum TaxID=454923 RepID=UPI0010FB667F|nr:chymotrypsin-2-like [Diachasma alloeum]
MAEVFGKFFLAAVLLSSATAGNERQERILGGSTASPGAVPYTVSLVLKGYHHVCGGTIITNRHILTAAHCFVGMSKPPYTKGLTVLTGAVDRTRDGEHHPVLKVTPHGEFKFGRKARWRNDIAVVTLADAIKPSKLQSPIALPTSRTPGNVIGKSSGWGFPGMNAHIMDMLQYRMVKILSNEQCIALNSDISEKQLCGFNGHGTGFCEGDSGGPLVYNNTVVGIVSFSVACGMGAPDVYTRVDSYLDFIKSVTSSKN